MMVKMCGSQLLAVIAFLTYAGAVPDKHRCAPPALPQNGGIDGAARTYYDTGDYVEYVCNYGYILVGSSVAVCIHNAEGSYWNNPPPQCRAIDCGQPGIPANGHVNIPDGTILGAKARYYCSKGFILVGSEFRTCQKDGQWTPELPECRTERCSELADPDNGQVTISGRDRGSIATYSCNKGYVLVGGATRTCLEAGEWSGQEPTCEAIDCGPPPPPLHGRVITLDGTGVGATARYYCDNGYVIIGAEFRTCQETGEWDNDVPTCTPKPQRCPYLPAPDKGTVDLTSGNLPGSVATYRCKRGYILVGEPTRKCRDTGQWTGQAPYCKGIDCGYLPNIYYGRVDVRSTTYRSLAVYSCDVGYKLVGVASRTCLAGGSWSGRQPTCRRIECGPLDYPKNGGVVLTGTEVGSTATYDCIEGYVLVGEAKRHCQTDGDWSGDKPHCKHVDCGTLPAPTNGVVTLTGTGVGYKAFYTCSTGYVLDGDDTRECLPDGTWSGQEPLCETLSCPKLHSPSNGIVRMPNSHVGGQAIYECYSGYALIGDVYRTCQENGEWDGEEPSCIYVDCGHLPDPRNGMVSVSGTDFGSKAKYRCNPGHELEGEGIRECQDNGYWSGLEPFCKFLGCGYLDQPDNGRVVMSGVSVGSTATYTCDNGYTLVGIYSTRTCLSNGEWSAQAPICRHIVVECPYLHNPTNGVVSFTGTSVGSVATYTCNLGYVLDGDYQRVCEASGVWSGYPPACRRKVPVVRCPELPSIQFGSVRLTGTSVGSTATYFCDLGYTTVGDRTRTCQASGRWSGHAPQCVYVDCGYLPDPKNGMVSVSGTDFGSKAKYRCNPGHELEGEGIRECQENGYWSGLEPFCKFLGCGYLDQPDNGRVVMSGVSVGSTATYTCDTGYTLVGIYSTRTCLSNGEWSAQAPICRHIVVECPYLHNPTNGVVSFTGTSVGSVATYTCNQGYVLDGDYQRVCEASGVWSGIPPACRPKKCHGLPNPRYGQVAISGTSYGATAYYSCDEGYLLVGEHTRTCSYGGSWTGKAPICIPIECEELSDPRNGRVVLSGTQIRAKATYICDEKFTVVGETTRVCQANGRWSGVAPLCEFIDCGGLEDPDKGQIVLSGTICGSTATYSCREGYTLVGDSTRTCQKDASWSGQAPFCTILECPYLSNPKNGHVTLTGTSVGSTATYTCSKGFILVGEAARYCQTSGRWSGGTPTCEPISCGYLESPENGVVVLTGTVVGSLATYSCDSGYILVGEETRTCQADSQWSGRAPTCEFVECPYLSDPKNGQVTLTGTAVGSTATYTCTRGFILAGEATRYCQTSGRWSGRTPTCKRISCGVLESPENGEVVLTGTVFGSLATYSCDSGYILVGEETRTCQADNQWSGRAPTCKRVRCPLLRAPVNGIIRFTGTSVGETANHVCLKGFELIGVRQRVCLSSGAWSGKAPVCREQVKCRPPHAPRNGFVNVPCTNLSCRASYWCRTGYELSGSRVRVCQSNGLWSGDRPYCGYKRRHHN